MRAVIDKELPSFHEVKVKFPLTYLLQKQVFEHRAEITSILQGEDERKLLIIGPCSAWPKEAVLNYFRLLKEELVGVEKHVKIVARVYTQKPRTTIGWTGPLNQIDPFKRSDIEEGIYYCRELMIEITKLGFAIADEALFTHSGAYFDDLISWYAVGARSSENQEHRIYASMLDHPVGIKNPTSGDIEKGVNSVIAAQHPHTFLLHSKQISTFGNPYAHLILRGGNNTPNISSKELYLAAELLQKTTNPAILIDASHENSIDLQGNKNPHEQKNVVKRILEMLESHSDLNSIIKGFMVESFIIEGSQKLITKEEINYGGLSITDKCIGFEETKELISLFK